jgi:hypothetical protein
MKKPAREPWPLEPEPNLSGEFNQISLKRKVSFSALHRGRQRIAYALKACAVLYVL